MILLLDNYDSFTYNVAGMLAERGGEVEVVRNDVATVAELLAMGPSVVVISPGPGAPDSAGVSLELVRACADAALPLYGICLGMQCIGAAFGASIDRLDGVVHGQATAVTHDGSGAFDGVPSPFDAGRYHSLVVTESTLPPELVPTARTADGVLMGVRHATLPIEGVQFHPESILTPEGGTILANIVAAAARAATTEDVA